MLKDIEEETTPCMVTILFKNGVEKEINVTMAPSQLIQAFETVGLVYKGGSGSITLMGNIINISETMCISIKTLEEEVGNNE